MPCNRNLSDHCCWMDGKACIFLQENKSGEFRWTCSLREELGSWEAVHEDERYKEKVQPFWDKHEERLGKQSCGNFKCVNCLPD